MLMRQLEYFVAVARERHFGRAADACFISRSALTTAINKLERELDVTLIERDQNFRGLTPEGKRLLAWAKQVLADRDRLTSTAAALRTGVSEVLHLGVGPTLSVSAAAAFVAKYYQLNPLANVEIHSRATFGELLKDLQHGELDVVIGRFDDQDVTGLTVTSLYKDPYVLVTPDRLILGEQSMAWPEVAELPLALLNCDTGARQLINEAFARGNSVADPRIETDSIAALFACVAAGEWASVVPRSWLRSMPTPAATSVVEIVEPPASELISIAVRSDDQSRFSAAFLDLTGDQTLIACDLNIQSCIG
jgi:DNA-binding transcriptional LysR family regulator